MRIHLNHFASTVLFVSILTSCSNYKKLITDEVVFTDGSSQTGTLMKSDSMNLKLKRIDESINILPWSIIDTVQGKKLKTLFLGTNIGYYKIPYFSVFRNEAMVGEKIGFQGKIGFALRGVKLYYFNFSHISSKPYGITKLGFGYQRYLGLSNYLLKKNNFFVGSEFNLMNAEYNTASQITLEPFTGFERKLNEHLRVHFKLGLQMNLANKNNQTGVNATIGIHFMKRNFKKYYTILNRDHRISRN